jgi:heme oxygenase (biliverdin-IX-beta and delta-forming)
MSQLLSDLKAQTRPHHDEIEKTIDFMREDMTLADYKNLLARFYGFYKTFEDFIADQDLPFDFSQRFKVPHLRQDLLGLGMAQNEIEALPLLRHSFPSSLAEILGQLYVIEGSTLGGMVLKKYFEKKFSITPEAGLSFFSGYGADTMKFWKEFQDYLIKYSSEENDPVIVDSAKNTFATLETWMK